MKIRTGLVLILLVLTLSLTTTAAVTQQNNPVPAWTLTQTVTQHQSTLKGMTITWGTETLTPTNTTGDQWFPSVGCFPDGSGFVIAWASDHTGDRDIYVKLFNETGHNQTDDIRMNGYTTGLQGAPSVCCFPDGSGFVVAWQSYLQDSSGYGVFFRVGYLPAPPSVFLLLAILFSTLSGPIISMLLLLGGGLAAAVLVGVLALWRFRRRR